jgi:tRNA pseudouridine55 synthase
VEYNNFQSAADFEAGTVLLMDKPLEWSSFDVVKRMKVMLKYGLGLKKVKIGHAGTLDPMATGLLVVCTGKMTKQIQFLQAEEKGYTGSIKFGATTPSHDLESEEEHFFPFEHLDAAHIQAAARSFEPGYDQVPPQFSARKVDGQRAYLAARKGKDVELKPSAVGIYRFDIVNYQAPIAQFDVRCSKGTYIRSLAFDLGERCNSGAYLTGLRRYQSGAFHVDNAFSLASFEERIKAIASSI